MNTLPRSILFSFSLLSSYALANDDSESLEFVHITAKRTAETTTNHSVSRVEDIQFMQATHINEIMHKSPGTWISRGNGQENLTAIRSPVLTGSGACSSFYMAEDNVPLRASGFCNANQLFDANYEQAQAIEVLRGPGTVFQGNTALHGVINILSPDFSHEKTTQLSALYSSLETSRLGIDHRQKNWMLQTHAASDQGYKDDSGYEQQKLRFKALQEGDNWDLTHSLNINNLDQETATYVVGKDAYKDDARKKENPNKDAYRKAQALRFSSELRFTPAVGKELIFTPYLRSNEMEFLMHYLPGAPVEKNGHNSIGFQSVFIRPYNDHIQLSSGFDMDLTRGFVKQYQQDPGPAPIFPQGEHYNYDVDSRDFSMFIQVDAQLSERWEFSTGLRVQSIYYSYDNNLSDGSACANPATNCRYYRPADDNNRFINISPQASLQFEFAAQNYSYLTLSRGARAPHTSDLYRLESGQVLADIDSEELDAAEIGFKGVINGGFIYQLAAFAMQKDNVIVKTNDRERVDGQKTQHQGIELAIDYSPIESLIFSLASTVAEHKYDSNIQLFNSGTENIKGNYIDTAPKHMHQISVSWLPNNKTKLQIEGIYMGDYFLDAENTFSYDGHTLTNIRLDQQFLAGFDLQLALINAADVDYAERADITSAFLGNPSVERYFIGEPRNIRISLNKTF